MESNTKAKNILCISSWYPNKSSSLHGIFVKRHAKALAIFKPVCVLHPVATEDVFQTEMNFTSETNFSELIVYYPKPKIKLPLLSILFKWLAYRKAILQGLMYLTDEKKIIFSLIWLNVVYPAGLGALLLKRKLKVPLILLEHWTGYLPEDGKYRGFFIRFLTKLTNHRSKCLIGVSENLLQNISRHGLKNEYHILHNVVEDVFFAEKIQEINPIQFIHVSSLDEEQKNIELLLEAFQQVKEIFPSIFLKIVGNQKQETRIKAIFKKHNLESESAVFLGEKTGKGLALEMSGCSALILSSRYENMPVVICEAMAMGIPIISSDVGGISEHVTEERGILFKSESVDDLYKAISEVCNGKKFNREEIRAYAAAQFTAEKVGGKLAQLSEKYEE